MFRIPFTKYVVIRKSTMDEMNTIAFQRSIAVDDLEEHAVDQAQEIERLNKLVVHYEGLFDKVKKCV